MRNNLIESNGAAAELPLSELRAQYVRGSLNRKTFEERIFMFMLDNYQRFHLFNWDKETYADYLCWLYPRLSRAIDAYQDVGASFDAYIAALVRWAAKEYRARDARHRVTERACWRARTEEIAESKPTYLCPPSGADTRHDSRKAQPHA